MSTYPSDELMAARVECVRLHKRLAIVEEERGLLRAEVERLRADRCLLVEASAVDREHAMSAADPDREWTGDEGRVCVACGEPWPCVVARRGTR